MSKYKSYDEAYIQEAQADEVELFRYYEDIERKVIRCTLNKIHRRGTVNLISDEDGEKGLFNLSTFHMLFLARELEKHAKLITEARLSKLKDHSIINKELEIVNEQA